LRDVVDAPDVVREQWRDQGVYEALQLYFDHILVYGDRSVVDPMEEYGLPGELAPKIQFTGYLGRSTVRLSRQRVRESLGLCDERLVVVHAGGGGDGSGLIGTYLQCVDALPDDIYSLVVTGPLMDRGERARLVERSHGSRVRLVDYQEDLHSYVAASDLTVCMGGYNSVAELLSVGTRGLVVPRVYPRAEQYIRARLLESRGLLRALDPEDLDACTLAHRVRAAMAEPVRPAQPVRLDGGSRAAAFLTSLLPEDGWVRMESAAVEVGAPS
jgi:predicted glycosyltransferase